MPLLDELRKKYPEFDAYSDGDLIRAASPAFGSLDDAANYFGVKRNAPGFATGLKTGLAGLPAGIGRLAEDFTPLERAGRGLRLWSEDVQFRNPTTVHSFEDFAANPWQGVKEIVGQGIGTVATSVIPYVGPVGRVLGATRATLAGTALSVPASYAGIRDTQEQTGQVDRGVALGGALVSSAVEHAGGVQRMLRPRGAERLIAGVPESHVAQFGSTPLRTFGKQSARVSVEEGAEELVQNPIEQAAGGQDPREHLGETAFGGFSGAIGGLLPFGVGSGMRRAMQQRAAQQYVDQNLMDAEAPFRARMEAAEIQRRQVAHNEGAEVGTAWWEDTMRGIYAEEQQRLSGMAPYDLLAGQHGMPDIGADNGQLFDQPINPYDVGGQVTAFNQGMDTSLDDPQQGLFGGGGFQQQAPAPQAPQPFQPLQPTDQPFQGLPHSGPAMPANADVETQLSRAAGVYQALSQVPIAPDSQEQMDFDWAKQVLTSALTPQQFQSFVQQIQPVAPAARAVAPKAGASAPAAPAQQPQGFGQQFKAAGGIHTGTVKALDAAQTPEEAVELVREKLENPVIAASTIRGLERLHEQITGKTYEQAKRDEAAAEATPGAHALAASPAVLPPAMAPTASGVQPAGQLPSDPGALPTQPRPLMHMMGGDAASETPATGTIPQDDPAALTHFLLEEVGKRNPRMQLVLESQWGVINGVQRTDAEIGQQLGISKQRVQQIGQQGRAAIKQVMIEHNITEDMFKHPELSPDTNGPEGSQSSFGQQIDPRELGAALVQDDAGVTQEIEGFKIRPTSEVNSSNIAGEVTMKDGTPTKEFHTTGDRQANERLRVFEGSAVERNIEGEAAGTWDAFAHLQSAQGEKVRPWEELAETETGQQTQRDWVAFYTETQARQADVHRNAAQVRELRQKIKDKYYSRTPEAQFSEEFGELTELDGDPILMYAVAKHIAAGFKPVFDARLVGFLQAERSDGWVGMAAHIDGKYAVIFSPQWRKNTYLVEEHHLARAVHHELWHVIDDAGIARGRYSSDYELGPEGRVRAEIESKLDDPRVEELFGYPLRSQTDESITQKELFAQALSALMTPKLRRTMSELLPLTYLFAEHKYEQAVADARSISQAAKIAGRETQARLPSGDRGPRVSATRPGRVDQTPNLKTRFTAEKFGLMPDEELEQTVELLKDKMADFATATQRVPRSEFNAAQEQLQAALVELSKRHTSRQRRAAAESAPAKTPKLHTRFTPAVVDEAQARAMSTVSDAWAKYKPTLLTLHQLVDQFGDRLPTLHEYVAAMGQMTQRQQELTQRAHQMILDWQALPSRTKDALHKVMLRATLRGIHPDEAFGPATPNAHVTDRAEYDAISGQYNALPSNARTVYKSARKTLEENWAARKAAFDKAATSAYQELIDEAPDAGKAAALTAERDQHIDTHRKAVESLKGPYFPLLRFGDYLTIARSKDFARLEVELEQATGADHTRRLQQLEAMKRQPAHYVVEAHANRHDAEQSARRYAAQGKATRTQLAEEHFRALQPVAAGAIERISHSLSSQFDKGVADKMKGLLTDLYISSLPEHAALQRQLRRVGVEGATEDMLRAVAKTLEKDAFHVARMEYADEIAHNLFKLKLDAKKASIEHQHVYNDLAARVVLDFEYRPAPIQSMLVRMSGIWHLGMSPAYLLTNLSQPWMITAPVLAGKFGLARSLSALRSAWVDAASVITQSKRGGGAFADIDMKAIADLGERAAVEHILKHGQIDINQTTDMGLIADGTGPRWLKAQKVFNWANHHIEVSNRITTALAAYRLARQGGMDQKGATDYAFKMIVDTQLDYSNANAAYWMKHGALPLGRVIFNLRKYQQGMLYLMARNAQLAFHGDKEALKALGYLSAMQLVFAGAVGMPVVTAPLAAFALFIGGGDDEAGDLETQLRNYLSDLMGPDAARAFWKGLPTLMGLDVSQRLGMGDMWKPLPFLRLRGKSGEEDGGRLALAALGAPVGMLARMWDGGMLMEAGDWQKGVEKMLPKMFADVVKADRYAAEGLTTRAGVTVMTPDRMDGWDIALRAAGFTPTVESEHYAAQQSKENTVRAVKEARSQVLRDYATLKLRSEDTTDAEAAIKTFNEKHPGLGFRIDRSAMIQAVQARRRAGAEVDEAGVRFRKTERGLQEITRYAQP